MKCKRCAFVFVRGWTHEPPRADILVAVDLLVCPTCKTYKTRHHIYTPGDMLDAELWGRRFEAIKHD